MPEPGPARPEKLAFKTITAIAAALLLYIGICGIKLSLRGYGNHDIYFPHSIIVVTTAFFMLVVVAVWLVLRAILQKDNP